MLSPTSTMRTSFRSAITSRMLWACVSMFVGIFVAYILEMLLHRSSKVEFELPVQDESVIAREVHGSHELPKVHAIHKNKRRDTEGDVVVNPVISAAANHELASSSPTQEHLVMEMPKSGYEMKSVSGNTRDLARENFFIDDKMREQLKTMGILSAIAIALHNIPEGIVTYVGFMDDPFVGLPLAIGIACHNIPEGLSVALPVYYATKSRNKAFFWSLLSGFAEPLGAILCMLVLQHFMNDYVFGFLFGFTGGIMTYICVCELIPTGLQMDCEKNYSMTAFLVGMGFIMISLILL